ncbi:MAG: ABC transporter substrate-binding protein [Bacillota bacterium]
MEKLKSVFKIISLLIIMLIGIGIFTNYNSVVSAQNNKTVKFGYVEWPGVTVKTHVAKTITEYLGYETEMTSGMKPTILKGLDIKDLDIFLGLWLPQMDNDFKPYKEKGSIEIVRVNLEDVVWRTGVPEYVWEAGIKSHEDLAEHADKFDHKWYGLEPGSSGNTIMQEAIKNNIYDLGDWKVVTSSEASMMAAVEKHINKNEWIAWSAWKPHWMNIKYDIKYLDDPEHIWAEEGTDKRVLTVTRDNFKKDMPNYYNFLKQFKITSPIQSEWILEYGKNNKPAEEVAKEWIANNLDIVNQWVFGVKSVDGRMARKVIAEKVEKNNN